MIRRKIKVGMWKDAPFKLTIQKCIDELNIFLNKHEYKLTYNIVDLYPECPAIDVLLLDGGEDIDPRLYGRLNSGISFNSQRDTIETILLGTYTNRYSSRKVKIAGICRGLQMINIYFGGTLVQDIPEHFGVSHNGNHDVKITKQYHNTEQEPLTDKIDDFTNPLVKFFGSEPSIKVSSLHHQCVQSLAYNLIPTLIYMHPEYGNVQILEGFSDRYNIIRAVQSHPEFKNFPKTDGLLFSHLMFVDYFIDANQKAEKDAAADKKNVVIDFSQYHTSVSAFNSVYNSIYT